MATAPLTSRRLGSHSRGSAARLSLWWLGSMALASLIGPALFPEALTQPSDGALLPPLSQQADGLRHWCGTDKNGQDLLYRLLCGARVSLMVGCLAALISVGIGTLYGMISGLVGGRCDRLMMRVLDALNAIPRVLIIMICIAAFDPLTKQALDGLRLMGQTRNLPWLISLGSGLLPYSKLLLMIVSLGLVEWLTMARLVRGQVLLLREMEFVTAARAMGQKPWRILGLHLLPNLRGLILTCLTMTIPAVILDESFLSFLGLGIEDPAASWGSLMRDGAGAINPLQSHWWLLLFPACLLTLSLLALYFITEALREDQGQGPVA